MTNNTINVPRELLENIVLCYNEGEFELGTLAAECHALLSAPSPAGVDGLPEFLTQELEAVGQEAVAKAVDDQCSSVPVLQAVYGEAIRKRVVDDAQAIIDGLAVENHQLRRELNLRQSQIESSGHIAERAQRFAVQLRTERDQQAQRIGELEGLLRETLEDMTNELWQRIDAALSAGKEGE